MAQLLGQRKRAAGAGPEDETKVDCPEHMAPILDHRKAD